jgi:protein O-GlcNAc transferase
MFDVELNNALRLRRAGKLAEAAAIYGEILRNEPTHFEALHALGVVRYQTGQLEEAERLIGQAVAVRPSAADALYNRASLLARLGRAEEALSCFSSAISVKPDYVEALTNRGVLLLQSNRFEEALADFDKVVALRPSLSQVWRNRAGVQEALGRLEDMLVSVERIAALEPNDTGALLKRADLLLQLNRAAEADTAFGVYLARLPDDAQAWNRRGIARAELKRKDEALAAFDKAVALNPADADLWNNRANALFEAKRFAEAATDYEKALRLSPDLPYAEGYLLQSRLRCCDWQGLGGLRRRIAEGVHAGKPVIDPLSHLAVPGMPEDQLACARSWVAGLARPVPPPLWRGEIYRHDKIRVAYLSADYRLHPVAYLLAGVFETHDRAAFEIVGISFTPPGANPMRVRIENACDRFHDVRDRTDDAAARVLREMEIDIAVDLMGYTDGCRPGILTARPAPVQVSYLGFPSTMGAAHMDYVLADATVIPEGDHPYFSEKVVTLPDCYLPGDSKRRIAERIPSRREAGLPERGFVFASFNDSYKISPEVFDVWMRLLTRVDGSVLWLAQGNPAAPANLKREAAARGVNPDRLIFASYVLSMDEHLARLTCADLVLDTLPYNAHASASDALWAGVPLATCSGNTFASRVAGSALKAVRLPELVTHTLADYEALAEALARDPARLAAIKSKLAHERSTLPLFDTPRFTHHLESAYRAMVERARGGRPPESFAVAAS